MRCYESLVPKSVASLRELADRLDDYGVDLDRVELDLGFGRGIGFYSRMVFELVVPTLKGPIEVCGGGRYDGLARVLGSDRDDRGVGFAFGSERLLDALRSRGNPRGSEVAETICVLVESTVFSRFAIRLANRLREAGLMILIETELTFEQWMKRSDRPPCHRCVIVRGNPQQPGSLLVRDLWDGTETIVTEDELLALSST